MIGRLQVGKLAKLPFLKPVNMFNTVLLDVLPGNGAMQICYSFIDIANGYSLYASTQVLVG